MTEVEKIKRCLNYIDQDTRDIWEALESFAGTSWAVFEKEVQGLYVVEARTRYSLVRFEAFVRKSREREDSQHIGTIDGFKAYHRTAATFAAHLKSSGRLSGQEAARIYASVFDGVRPEQQRLRHEIRPWFGPATSGRLLLA